MGLAQRNFAAGTHAAAAHHIRRHLLTQLEQLAKSEHRQGSRLLARGLHAVKLLQHCSGVREQGGKHGVVTEPSTYEAEVEGLEGLQLSGLQPAASSRATSSYQHWPPLTGGSQQVGELLASKVQRCVQRIGAPAQRHQRGRQHRSTSRIRQGLLLGCFCKEFQRNSSYGCGRTQAQDTEGSGSCQSSGWPQHSSQGRHAPVESGPLARSVQRPSTVYTKSMKAGTLV